MPTIAGALTDDDQIAAILDEVGDTSDGKVERWVVLYWEKYAGKAQLDRQLQTLYTTRDCFRLKLTAYSEQVDFQAAGNAVSFKLSQSTGFLTDRIKEIQTEIERLELKARKRRVAVAVQLTTVVPISVQDELNREALPPPLLPDPSNPGLAGSPFVSLNRNPNQVNP